MAKAKIAYVCSACGSDFTKWQGQCTDCGEWNSLTEFRVASAASAASNLGRSAGKSGYAGAVDSRVRKLSDVEFNDVQRLSSGFSEFDRVLGGGLVPGSAVLIGGNPGAGKSTLLLQVVCGLAAQYDTLYVTGEESPQQVAMRAKRLGLPGDKVNILSETCIETLLPHLQQQPPRILVVDSIQVMYREDISSAPGSVSQVRECAAALTRFAKQTQTILLLVGHVTKEGSLAGPKVLEHMIDCSILLDNSSDERFRMLRSQKNRFGAVNELGVFAMLDTGLKEVTNPSAIFLNRAEEQAPGSIVTIPWEGSRPLLVEIQALVDDTHFNNPRRVVVGIDGNRLAMLLAVLHRHGGIALADQDVFANVVGGVKVAETSADLPLLLAALSSLRNRPLPRGMVAMGEVGLSGEIRPVSNGQERLKEAAKHGFTRAIVPKANVPKKAIKGLTISGVSRLDEAIQKADE